MIVPAAPLRHLLRRKARGRLRVLRRRLATPVGLVFALLGLGVFALWIGSVWLHQAAWRERFPPELAAGLAGTTLTLFAVMVVFSALAQRGLYVPQGEIERLFSSPVSRADLVRYRLLSVLGQSAPFTLFVSAAASLRMPVPAHGFLGAALALCTLPVLGQGTAILLGDAETRVGRLVGRLPAAAPRLLVGLALGGVLSLLFLGAGVLEEGPAGDVAAGRGGPGAAAPWLDARAWDSDARDTLLRRVVEHPVCAVATRPVRPWARAMAAPDAATFWPAWGLAALLTLGIWELVARLPVDDREASLATSSQVARRVASFRSGRGAVGGLAVSRRSLAWRIPWFFGRSPAGAVAWLKCCSIARKSRGTALFSLFVTAFAATLAWQVFADPFAGAVFVSLLATVYLCAGLRFDFRGDLDWMEVVLAWPLRPWRLFLATLLPQTALISAFVASALLVRAHAQGTLPPEVLGVLVATPVVTMLWLAIDNALFLLAPVRYVPGQTNAMHHVGRSLVLLLARLAAVGAVGLAVALAALGASLAASLAGASPRGELALTVAAAGATSLAMLAAAVAFGGWALGRFDVSRDGANAL